MPFNLLLLPFLGGYLLLRRLHFTRFRLARLDTQRLLIWMAIAGVLLVAAAGLLVLVLAALWPIPGHMWHGIVPFPHSGKALGAFLLGVVAPSLINRLPWFSLDEADEWGRRAVRDYGNEVEHVLLRAQQQASPVMVTLGSGKVYVGMVERNPNLEIDRRYLRLIPIVSGYRNKETHRVTFDTNYSLIKEMSEDPESPFHDVLHKDFDIVMPLAEVKTLHLYSLEAFEAFEQTRATETQPAPSSS
ncbi:MAG: hypothetical protein IAE99_12900 [Rhodothermales bacterium]|nr:hypothetical protein [Rhodothermales bacterium]